MGKICRRLLWPVISLAAVVAGSGLAVADSDDPNATRVGEKNALSGYVGSVGNRLLIGVNSLLTFPADPVVGALDIAFSPVTPVVMLSPEPRYLLFEGAEHEVY